MKAKELIEVLSKHPDLDVVFYNGECDGYNDSKTVSVKFLYRASDIGWTGYTSNLLKEPSETNYDLVENKSSKSKEEFLKYYICIN